MLYPDIFVLSNFVARWIEDIGVLPDVILWISIFGVDPLRYYLGRIVDYLDQHYKRR